MTAMELSESAELSTRLSRPTIPTDDTMAPENRPCRLYNDMVVDSGSKTSIEEKETRSVARAAEAVSVGEGVWPVGVGFGTDSTKSNFGVAGGRGSTESVLEIVADIEMKDAYSFDDRFESSHAFESGSEKDALASIDATTAFDLSRTASLAADSSRLSWSELTHEMASGKTTSSSSIVTNGAVESLPMRTALTPPSSHYHSQVPFSRPQPYTLPTNATTTSNTTPYLYSATSQPGIHTSTLQPPRPINKAINNTSLPPDLHNNPISTITNIHIKNMSNTQQIPGQLSQLTGLPNNPMMVMSNPMVMPMPIFKPPTPAEAARAILLSTYSPHLIPTDTSLATARIRLRTALEQTRRLRQSFTSRVYDKYRVLLRPVPSTESIMTQIDRNPGEYRSRLRDRTARLKEEKETEKREAQAARPPEDGQAPPNPEESLFGAGLSLVVLPEDTSFTSEDMRDARYVFRGPHNQSGQRNGGISSAAAAAAEAVLDRARKANVKRVDRKQRGPSPSEGSRVVVSGVIKAAALPTVQAVIPPVIKQPKRTEPILYVPPPSKSSRPAVSSSPASLLSLSTRAEPAGSAIAAALRTRGVGTNSRRSLSQQSLRHRFQNHPHPNSRAASFLQAGLGGSTGRKQSAVHSSQVSSALAEVARMDAGGLSLPAVLDSNGRKTREKDPPYKGLLGGAGSGSADSVKTVLSQFYATEGEKGNGKELMNPGTRKRRVTEIGLLRNLRSGESAQYNPGGKPQPRGAKEERIDPVLTFSVLHALGIFGDEKDNVAPRRPVSSDTDMAAPFSVRTMNLKEKSLEQKEHAILDRDPKLIQTTNDTNDTKEIISKKEPQSKTQKIREGDVRSQECKPPTLPPDPTPSLVDKKINQTEQSDSAPSIPSPSIYSSTSSLDDEKESDKSTPLKPPVRRPMSVKSIPTDADLSKSYLKGIVSKPNQTLTQSQKRQKDFRPNPSNAPPHPSLLANMPNTHPSMWNPNSEASKAAHAQLLHQMTSLESSFPMLPQSVPSGIHHRPSQSTPPAANGFPNTPQQCQFLHPNMLGANDQRIHHHLAQQAMHAAAARHSFSMNDSGAPADFSEYYLNGMGFPPHPFDPGMDWGTRSQFDRMGAAWNLNNARAYLDAQVREQARLLMVRERAMAVDPALGGWERGNLLGMERKRSAAQQQQLSQFAAAGMMGMEGMRGRHFGMGMFPPNSGGGGGKAGKKNKGVDVIERPASAIQPPVTKPPSVKPRSNSLVIGGESATKTSYLEKKDSSKQSKLNAKSAEKISAKPFKHLPSVKPPPTNIQSQLPAVKQKDIKPTNKQIPDIKPNPPKNNITVNSTTTSNLRFFIPKHPAGLSQHNSEQILRASIHKLQFLSQNEQQLATGYLMSVYAAVPIPKALVANPFKERLAGLAKSLPGGATVSVPKDVVAATITAWLWSEHRDCFQRAFVKSGRIDVDPECKWLIQAAADASIRAILIETDVRGGKLGGNLGDFGVARLVSRALMKEVFINEEMDSALSNLESLAHLLDERRTEALRTVSRERVLLANFLSRNIRISESFSNAYTSCLVRAGEALGHEDLCEIVQDEDCNASTLLPYDMLSDASGAWEDPCRQVLGFVRGLNGDELTRRGHARARIQKSLWRLQERFDIEGGVVDPGPYGEVNAADDKKNATAGSSLAISPVRSDSSSKKTRRSISVVGTADSQAVAVNSALTNPSHVSEPLVWDPDDAENTPYGKYEQGKSKKRSSAAHRYGSSASPEKKKKSSPKKLAANGEMRCTKSINWSDVAKRFEPVYNSQTNNNTPTDRSSQDKNDVPNIFAPFFRKVSIHSIPDFLPAQDDEIDDNYREEEDISDDAVLARHQVVLNDMKMKMEVVMEATQSRRASLP